MNKDKNEETPTLLCIHEADKRHRFKGFFQGQEVRTITDGPSKVAQGQYVNSVLRSHVTVGRGK